MNIVYQYYNEVVLAFNGYEVEFHDGVIIILVPDDSKPFDFVCKKIETQLLRIADTLDIRDQDVVIQIKRPDEIKNVVLGKQES